MPNYVYNTIYCKKELLPYIMKNEEVSFNILVPQPTSATECLEKYGEKYLDSEDENGNSTKHLCHSATDKWFNWYDWCCDFWGTKWDALDGDCFQNGELYRISFTTAWAPPSPWIEKLAEIGEPFIHHWLEEQGYGSCHGYNGNEANQIDYGIQDTYKYNPETEEWEDADECFPNPAEIEEFFSGMS